MLHTPLHRVLGLPPGDLTDQMIDAAIAEGVEEGDDLDWKKELPPQKSFRDSDIVKDIAAFANAGGGVIVFGVSETNKRASGRSDAGELTEGYERTIQQACMTAITPPVFGVQVLGIATLARQPSGAVAVVVPPSPDGPHLVYKNDYFGAPLRVGSDTVWMRERQVEAAYRARFEAARQADAALQEIYDDLLAGMNPGQHAVLVGAARPRVVRPHIEHRDDVGFIGYRAALVARWWLASSTKEVWEYHPLEDVAAYDARPTLRGLHMPPKDARGPREAHAVVYDDGSLGISWLAGGHENLRSGKKYEPHQISSLAIEGFCAALVSLIHAVAVENPGSDYELIVGVEMESSATELPEFHEVDAAPPSGVHQTLSGRFRPVRATVDPSATDEDFVEAAVDLATACLNQIGLQRPRILSKSLPRRPREWSW